jgi:hypothetical protein
MKTFSSKKRKGFNSFSKRNTITRIGAVKKGFSLIFVFTFFISFAAYGGGRKDYENHCLICHGESAPPIYPADRVKDQWEEFFEKDFKKIHKGKNLKIPPQILRRIKEYVETYAADSDQPEGATF